MEQNSGVRGGVEFKLLCDLVALVHPHTFTQLWLAKQHL